MNSVKTLKVFLIIITMGLANTAMAATYYVSPNGNNSGDGSSSAPWRTFGFAIPRLNPGDTLVLKDGTYTRGTTGLPNINCAAGAKNGTASAPINIQAENERRAWLKGDGTTTVLGILNCSYWNVIGLRASDADNASGESFFQTRGSTQISFRRNLLSNSNRLVNQAMITYYQSNGGLVEENELYDYVRHGIMLAGHTSGVVVRRNYANSRDYPSIGGRTLGGPISTGGDSAVAIYPGSNNIVENNISERNSGGFNVQASHPSVGNKFFGNISLKDRVGGGLRIRARGNSLNQMPQNTHIENQVVIDAEVTGGDFRANKNTLCLNCSIFESRHGIYASTPEYVGDGSPTTRIQNSLSVNNSQFGIGHNNYSSFVVTNSNSFGNGTNYSPGSLSSGNMSVDPGLGSCKVFIPDSSPMKGKGSGGGDIGANVLCRYENGVLTDKQLWHWTTGQFPCGAIVAGVNDKAGASCFDVHKRLNVNTNGCSLPANPSCKQPSGIGLGDSGATSAGTPPPCCI